MKMIGLFCVFCLYACQIQSKESKAEQSLYEPVLIPIKSTPMLQSMCRVFIDSMGMSGAVKELAINKISQDETIITIVNRKADTSYRYRHHPFFIYHYSNVDSFFVYTGAENIITNTELGGLAEDKNEGIYNHLTFVVNSGLFQLATTSAEPFWPLPKPAEYPKIDVSKFEKQMP